MNPNAREKLLRQELVYDGEDYDRDSLQTLVKSYNDKHKGDLSTLSDLQQSHDEIAKEMSKDLAESKTAWEYLQGMISGGFSSNLRGLLEKVPILNDFVSDRPLAELLREKVEVAERRTKQVGHFLAQVEQGLTDLQTDITRLNKKVVVAARNEELAATHVLALRNLENDLEGELAALGDGKSAAHREKQLEIDEVKQAIWKHGAKLRLFSNAEDRISAIVVMNNNFLQILTSLHANMQTLYEAGTEVLDELRGNLSGLATAARASELSQEMQESMQSLKQSVNKVAVLASTTSLHLTQNMERLTSEMKMYDEATETLISSNLEAEKEIREQRIDETIALAEKEYGLLHEAREEGP